MWFDGVRQPNTLYIASVSRGKDSTAMLRAIQILGFPLDGIVSVDVWFDDDTPAELPPMVAVKDEWDEKCLQNFGVPVTRLCATCTEDKKHRPFANPLNVGGVTNAHTQTTFTETEAKENSSDQESDSRWSQTAGAENSSTNSVKLTYCDIFYRNVSSHGKCRGVVRGFPIQGGNWCNSGLKGAAITDSRCREAIGAQAVFEQPPWARR